MKIVIDTNVILDFFLSRQPYAPNAKLLFTMVYKGQINAYVTANSVTDIYYISTKKLGKFSARKVVKNLLKVVDVISVDGDDCISALDFPIQDFEDSLIVTCAIKEKINYIVTNDKDFLQTSLSNKNINIINLHDFINLQ